MTELKTLKELIHLETSEHHRFLDIEELKSETIKWVKHYRNMGLSKCAVEFEEFFNLTEEDLK